MPLVLHGSSGVADDVIADGRARGHDQDQRLDAPERLLHRAIRETLDADATLVDSRKYLTPARDALAAEAARLLRLFALPLGGPDTVDGT